MRKLHQSQRGFGAIEGILVVVVVLLLGVIGYMVYKTHHKTAPTASSATSTTASSTPASTTQATDKTYSDTAKTYAVDYPQAWAVKQTTDNGLGAAPLLDAKDTQFVPNNLPSGAAGNTSVVVTSYKTGDPSAALSNSANATSETINGYKALYVQEIVPATPGSNGLDGGIGYSDDMYAVSHNGVTVVFDFRFKQDGNGAASSFDVSNLVPAFKTLVTSIKFTN